MKCKRFTEELAGTTVKKCEAGLCFVNLAHDFNQLVTVGTVHAGLPIVTGGAAPKLKGSDIIQRTATKLLVTKE